MISPSAKVSLAIYTHLKVDYAKVILRRLFMLLDCCWLSGGESLSKPSVIPKRDTKKAMITFAVDHLAVIDSCAKAVGYNRSTFLQIYFDKKLKDMVRFTEIWLHGSQFEAEFPKVKGGK